LKGHVPDVVVVVDLLRERSGTSKSSLTSHWFIPITKKWDQRINQVSDCEISNKTYTDCIKELISPNYFKMNDLKYLDMNNLKKPGNKSRTSGWGGVTDRRAEHIWSTWKENEFVEAKKNCFMIWFWFEIANIKCSVSFSLKILILLNLHTN
jgi:hypothetical protein